MKLLIKISALLIIVGLAVSVVFGVIAREELKDESDLVSESFTFEKDLYTSIEISVQNNPIKVLVAEDEEIKITFKNYDYEKVENLTTDGKVYIKVYANWWDNLLKGSTFVGFMDIMQDRTVYIHVPEKLFDYNLRTSNGKIIFDDVDANNVNLKTSNGAIVLSSVTINNAVLRTSNGAITLDSVIGKEVDGMTSNGAITLKDITADELIMETSNGAVTGSNLSSELVDIYTSNGPIRIHVVGHFRDYKVRTKTSNGSVKINDQTYGNDTYNETKTPYVKTITSNGRIEIFFTLD